MFTITYDMAIDLLKMYVEQIHIAEYKRGVVGKQLEKWMMARDNLTRLLVELKVNGYDTEKILADIREELHLKFSHYDILVRVDGAARGNNDVNINNESGYAFIIYGDGKEIARQAEYLGAKIKLPNLITDSTEIEYNVTNNVAEYIALIKAIEYLIDHKITAPNIIIISDSNVVVQQVNLIHTTKAPHLVRLRDYVLQISKALPSFKIIHANRNENAEVDKMVNKILDETLEK